MKYITSGLIVLTYHYIHITYCSQHATILFSVFSCYSWLIYLYPLLLISSLFTPQFWTLIPKLQLVLMTCHSQLVNLNLSILTCPSQHVILAMLLLTCNFWLFICHFIYVTLDILSLLTCHSCYSWLFTLQESPWICHRTLQDHTEPIYIICMVILGY